MPASILFEELKKQFDSQNAVPSLRWPSSIDDETHDDESAPPSICRGEPPWITLHESSSARAHFCSLELSFIGRSVICSHPNHPRN
jgi:hypothetical protein